MPKIIAIGGGEIGRPGFSIETTRIDKEIIKLSNKKGRDFFLFLQPALIWKGMLKLLKDILVKD